MNADARGRLGAQPDKRLPFLSGNRFVARVREHEKGIVMRPFAAVQILQHRDSVAKNVPRHFVVDRNQQGNIDRCDL